MYLVLVLEINLRRFIRKHNLPKKHLKIILFAEIAAKVSKKNQRKKD